MKKILIAGAPFVGKFSLMKELVAIKGRDVYEIKKKELFDPDCIWHVKFDVLFEEIIFITSSGPLFDREKVWSNLLIQADMVLYMFSGNPSSFNDDQYYFEFLSKKAKELRKNPENLPWIVVLNKVDISKGNVIARDFAERFETKIFDTVCLSSSRFGVEEVFEYVILKCCKNL